MQQQDGLQNQTADQILNTMKILWMVLLASNLILVGIAYKVFAQPEPVETDLKNIFLGIAFVIFAITHIMPKTMFKQGLATLSDKSEKSILTLFFTPFILSLSLSEAITILGFLLVKMTGDFNLILPFALVAMLNMVHFFPKRDKILQQAGFVN